MPFKKNHDYDFFYINSLVFIVNMLIGYYIRNTPLVVSSAIALAISLYIYGQDYGKHNIWFLDQIAMLAVLLPGFIIWLTERPDQHIFAGLFFLTGIILYLIGLLTGSFGHSNDDDTRERWHLYLHLFSTAGHQLLTFEGLLLLYLGLKNKYT